MIRHLKVIGDGDDLYTEEDLSEEHDHAAADVISIEGDCAELCCKETKRSETYHRGISRQSYLYCQIHRIKCHGVIF